MAAHPIMKPLSLHVDEATQRKIAELARAWGAPPLRFNTLVAVRCIERVWMEDIKLKNPRPVEWLPDLDNSAPIASFQFDDETVSQMSELAELWGLPSVRHSTLVIGACVHRIWKSVFLDNTG